MRRILILATALVALTGTALSQRNNTPEARLRAAMDKETIDGDLKAAIDGYKKVIEQKGASRETIAQALLRLGMAYEKQGDAEARKPYERIIKDFADQPALAQQARARLASVATASASAGPVIRQVCPNSCTAPISPDGRFFFTGSPVNGDPSIRFLDTETIRRFPLAERGNGSVCCVAISDDSKRIAYAIGNRNPLRWGPLVTINADGTGQRIFDRPDHPLAWSRDGARLLIGRQEDKLIRLAWFRLSDTSVQDLPILRNIERARISPDEKYIVVSATPDPDGDQEANIFIMAIDGSGEIRVSPSPYFQEPLGWSPDGKLLFFAQYEKGQSIVRGVPMINGKPAGAPLNVRTETTRGAAFLGITPNGALLYRTGAGVSDLYTATMDRATGRVTSAATPIPAPSVQRNVAPRLSPDGNKLLYQTNGPNTAPNLEREFHLISLTTTGLADERISTPQPFGGNKACWLSDTSIVFNSVKQPQPLVEELLRLDLNTKQTTPAFPGAAPFRAFGCSAGLVLSRRGNAIALRDFLTGRESEPYRAPAGSNLVGNMEVSPDGQSIAFTETTGDSASLKVTSALGGLTRELLRTDRGLLQQGLSLAFSPDSRYVYYVQQADNRAPQRLYRLPITGGTPEYMGLEAPNLRDIDIAPNGSRIAFSIGNVGDTQIWSVENFMPR